MCGLPGQLVNLKVDTEGLDEPSRGGLIGYQVAPGMAISKSPPLS